jgi:hypothetical protein
MPTDGEALDYGARPDRVEHYLSNPYLGRERSRLTLIEWHCYFGTVPPGAFREVVTLHELNVEAMAPP